MYPVSQYVMPYLLDQNRAFTLNTKNSTCGGMFICPKTLEVIQQYIKDVFPTAEIFNDTTTGHTNSPSMQ
jgi:hypothetical protein